MFVTLTEFLPRILAVELSGISVTKVGVDRKERYFLSVKINALWAISTEMFVRSILSGFNIHLRFS